MDAPLIRIETVWHVGTLELDSKTDRPSLEGDLLSVSEHPDEWSMIARCAGVTWEMNREGALWLDALALSDEQLADIRQWATDQGLAEATTIWRVWHYDGEADDWAYFEFDNETQARREIEDDDDASLAAMAELLGHEVLEPIDGHVLTDAGMAAVGRWAERTQAEDALIILWADQVLKPANPDLMGVWWFEHDNPASLSCPRGGAFTDRLGEFEITNDHGAGPPDSFTDRHFAEPRDASKQAAEEFEP